MTIRLAVVGLGKMGISHLGMINAHPDVKVVAVCDSFKYLTDMLVKYMGVKAYSDYDTMLKSEPLDAVLIATPSRLHAPMARKAFEKGLHAFCEKPLTLDWTESKALGELAAGKGLVAQAGYHYRFVGAFQEVKRLLETGAIGQVSHVMAEAYGPVVLKRKGSTWRTKSSEGGGCLYDYAAHPLDLLDWFFGSPTAASGSVLGKIFSEDTEDEVYATLTYASGMTGQLSVNWSDESFRKMGVKITVWGTGGRLTADRQECQVYLRGTDPVPAGYEKGWNSRYTTDLTEPVWFYMRGEEYSAQLDYFVQKIKSGEKDNVNSFSSAANTDRTIAMIVDDARGVRTTATSIQQQPAKRGFSLFSR